MANEHDVNIKFNVTGTEQVKKSVERLRASMLSAMNVFRNKGVFGLDNNQFKLLHPIIKETGTRMERLGSGVRYATMGFKGFRMELLGVMFFGQAIARTFSGMLQPIMDVFAITELWTATLQITFLPIMEAIFPYLLGMMEFFMNLPDSVKLAIGVITLLAIAFGTILSLVGAISLGLGAIFATTTFTAGIAALGAALAPVLIVLVAIAAIAAVIYLAWKENFGGIRDWIMVVIDSIKNMFIGLFEVIKGIFKFISALINGDADKMKEAFMIAATGIKIMFYGLGEFIIGIFVSIPFLNL